MMINFLTTADFLQSELREFYRVLRRERDQEMIDAAIQRLRTVVDKIEPLADDPGDSWQSLAMEQRWGYMRVLSHLGTAAHELKCAAQRGRTQPPLN
ncbi:MAG: hypothetical protein AB7G75_18045 [Candidatus Binatia bacterium]